jgi:hypothetical protein
MKVLRLDDSNVLLSTLVDVYRIRIQTAIKLFRLSRRTSTRDLHVAFKIPYIYGFVTKLCRQQTEIIPNHENVNVRNTGQAELNTEKNKKAQTWWRSGIRLFKRLSYCYLLW